MYKLLITLTESWSRYPWSFFLQRYFMAKYALVLEKRLSKVTSRKDPRSVRNRLLRLQHEREGLLQKVAAWSEKYQEANEKEVSELLRMHDTNTIRWSRTKIVDVIALKEKDMSGYLSALPPDFRVYHQRDLEFLRSMLHRVEVRLGSYQPA